MELNIPQPQPRKDGDYKTFVSIGYGNPWAIIHLAENGTLDLRGITVDDCDRLIRAAAEVKEQLLRYQAEAAAPHGRANIYQGTCQLCGKPEDDELHASPETCEWGHCHAPAVASRPSRDPVPVELRVCAVHRDEADALSRRPDAAVSVTA